MTKIYLIITCLLCWLSSWAQESVQLKYTSSGDPYFHIGKNFGGITDTHIKTVTRDFFNSLFLDKSFVMAEDSSEYFYTFIINRVFKTGVPEMLLDGQIEITIKDGIVLYDTFYSFSPKNKGTIDEYLAKNSKSVNTVINDMKGLVEGIALTYFFSIEK